MKIRLNETDEIGFNLPTPLLLDVDEIRSVERFSLVNGLSNTVSRVTLKGAITHSDDFDSEYLAFVTHIVFETVDDIHKLMNGERIEFDYSTLSPTNRR